jgi:YfiH family protein
LQKVVTESLKYYQFGQWSDLRHGVFTRLGGYSAVPWASLNMGGNVGDSPVAVRENHKLMYAALNLCAEHACSVWQVHGADIVIVDRPANGRRWLSMADSMITNCLDTPLVMRFADCTPILLYDPVQGVIGMAHAGWRGTVQGVGAKSVRAMMKVFGCKVQNIQAGIGPCIGPDRYQVGEEVISAVQNYFGGTEGLIRRNPQDGTTYLNLWAANKLDLQRAGIEQIEVAEICTADNLDEFFSHRAEQGRTGRFGAVLSL